MRCDEVKKYIIDVIYSEGGIPSEKSEIKGHLRTCPACRKELEELTQARKYLQRWEDESPLRSVTLAGKSAHKHRSLGWKYMRYAAVAAMVLITILALSNTQMTWNKDGFSFSTHLFPAQVDERDYYTRTELRNLLKEVLDDSEARTNEIIYLMMQETLNTVEQDRWMDLSLISSYALQNQNN